MQHVIRAGAAYVYQTRLASHRRMVVINHRSPPYNPALPSAPDEKIIFQRPLPIFACSAFRSTGGSPAAGADMPA
ncbi:hypothetical protein AWV79_04235 [Cupriavidus sp. UYMMa02A]|nr:hypothetical protein AWV79_04235 [Cupriavidus sp. UYMMa02A]